MRKNQVLLFGKIYDLTPATDGPGLDATQPVPDIAGMIRRTVPAGPEHDRLLARADPGAFITEVLADGWVEAEPVPDMCANCDHDPAEPHRCDKCGAVCDHRVQVCECGPDCPYPPVV